MQIHLSFETREYERSIAFYRTLFETAPSEHANYALFVVENPPLELVVSRAETVVVSPAAHFGVRLAGRGDLDAAAARLKAAGFEGEPSVDGAEAKVWVTDPDGRRWELYFNPTGRQEGASRAGDGEKLAAVGLLTVGNLTGT